MTHMTSWLTEHAERTRLSSFSPSLVLTQIATASLSSALTRYSVKDYYLKAGICHLCTGVSGCIHQVPLQLLDLRHEI